MTFQGGDFEGGRVQQGGSGGGGRRGVAVGGGVVGLVVVAIVAHGSGGGGPTAEPTTTAATSAPATSAPAPFGTATTQPAAQRPTSGPTAATTTVPATGGATGDRPTDPPVALQDSHQPAPGLSVKLASLEPITGVANLPGEVGGPSLQVTVEVTNTTSRAVDLSSTVVNLYTTHDLTPAIELSSGESPMKPTVAPGASVQGVYVFNVPVDQRDFVTVEVDLATAVPVTLFQGAAPAA